MNFGGRGDKPKIAFGKISLAKPEEKDNEEVSTAGFGSFGGMRPPPLAPPIPAPAKTEEELEMEATMGFSGFGSSKKEKVEGKKSAKNFDVKEMVEAIKRANKKKQLAGINDTDKVIVPEEDEDEDYIVTNKKLPESKPEEKEGAAVDEEDDDDMIGPMPAPPTAPAAATTTINKTKTVRNSDSDSDSSDDDDDDEKDEEENDKDADADSDKEAEKSFPIEHCYEVEHGIRPVTALAVDPTATRFATGSLDYEVKLWDFTGLRNRHAFRTTKPCENHPIKHVSFATNGESVLVISGSAQAKVLNREGSELLECIKGDQYIVDMARTNGHVSALTGGMFHPKNKSEFMTSSDDSTVRLWEVENPKAHKTLVKLKNAGGLKNRVTACTYARDGVCFMGGGIDGTICMWDTRKPLVLPTATIKNAHLKGSDIFHITYSNSGMQVSSRGEDGIVNIFDTRNWRTPLFKSSSGQFPAKFFTTDLSFSPDDRHLLIPALPHGTTGRTRDESITHSSVKFFSTKTLEVVKEYNFDKQIVIRSVWPHRINQILVSFASGKVGVLYDTKKSQRGALLAHGKGPKKQRQMGVVEDMYGKVVITPNSLPLYKVERSKNPKREEAKLRADPVKSRRPDLPITAGSGGRVAASGSTLSSYVIRNLGLSKSVKDDMDPREAILKYAKDAAENPIWVTPAYKNTQPKPIFDSGTDEEGETPESKKPRLG